MQASPSKTLTESEKLRKVITELLETERAYVRHLQHLMETYLEPLRQEAFLSNSEISALFGNIREIYQFQQGFLRSLEEAVESADGTGSGAAAMKEFDEPAQFKVRSSTGPGGEMACPFFRTQMSPFVVCIQYLHGARYTPTVLCVCMGSSFPPPLPPPPPNCRT